MNITKEQVGELGAVIKIAVQPEDYSPKVDKVIRKYQHDAKVPGFRPGKIPVGMIKKMYGKAVLIEVLNDLLSETLNTYIFENKIEMLGSPLPKQPEKAHVYEENQSFEFLYEIGLAPQVEVEVSEKDKLPYYLVKVDDKMIDNEIGDLRRRYGKFSNPETSAADNILYGDFEELDETGNPKAEGHKTTTTIALEMIKDPIEKSPFVGLKKEDSLTFNPMKTMGEDAEVSAMLNVGKDSPVINSDYKFTVRTINALEKAEINQELFDKLYGEAKVNSEEEFRGKIKETIMAYFEVESDHKLKKDLQPYLIEKLNISLPDDFLKRMLKASDEKLRDIDEHEFEHQYYHMAESLRWDLIRDYVARTNNVTITEEEIKALGRAMVRRQFSTYGIHDIDTTRLEEVTERYIKDKDHARQIEKGIVEDKVFQILKSKMKLVPEELPYEEFRKKLEEKTEHELEHHH